MQVLNNANSPEVVEMLSDYANKLENLAIFDFSESELEPDVLANLIINLSFAAPSLKSINLSGRQEQSMLDQVKCERIVSGFFKRNP